MIVQESGTDGENVMAAKKRFIRATMSLDKEDYQALGRVADRMDVSSSWLVRQAIREFLEKYGTNGQPELALRLADKHRE